MTQNYSFINFKLKTPNLSIVQILPIYGGSDKLIFIMNKNSIRQEETLILNGQKAQSCWKLLLHLLSSMIAWQKVINSKVSTCKKLAITNSNGTPTYLSIDLVQKQLRHWSLRVSFQHKHNYHLIMIIKPMHWFFSLVFIYSPVNPAFTISIEIFTIKRFNYLIGLAQFSVDVFAFAVKSLSLCETLSLLLCLEHCI